MMYLIYIDMKLKYIYIPANFVNNVFKNCSCITSKDNEKTPNNKYNITT